MQQDKRLPDGRFVFATAEDCSQIRNLWQEAFNDDDEYINGFLKENFTDRRILMFKNESEVISMASLFFVKIDGKKAVYIFALATKEAYKGRGVATAMLDYIQELYECTIILQPEKNGVEKFYEKIGFQVLDANTLYSVCAEYNITDLTLGVFDGFIREYQNPDLSDINFAEIEPKNIAKILKFFSLRANKACESNPLSLYLYHSLYVPEFCIIGDACFVIYKQNGEVVGATLPYCCENELAKSFKIQEKYFTQILGKKHLIFSANIEGVKTLENSGAFDGYELSENLIFKDYLYSGEAMRTLAGKKLSKKRNLIHQFEKNYAGRWEYVHLTADNKTEIFEFVENWYENYPIKDDKLLIAEHSGVRDVILHDEMYSVFNFGGIKIDGRLKAISIGSYNNLENMAVIDVEKADPQINGLYQLINREFLLHEFPNAVLVNREDDIGEENIRKAKMSYNPIGFEKKYNIKANN